MRLMDGAEAIRGDLPSARTIVVTVPLEAGEAQDSRVSRFTSIQLVRDRQAQALATIEGMVLTIGGDCGVELAAVGRATDLDPSVGLVWFDAHPDLNTPESSPSAAFNGMVLRTLVGDGPAGLVPARPVDRARVVLVGARELDEGEESFLADTGIRAVDVSDATPEAVVEAVAATGVSRIYLHIDLDVLDPVELTGLDSPVPFGLAATELVATIRALRARFEVVGAGITEFAPSSAEAAVDDLPTILRLIGALTS
jgi:arginase